MKKILSITLAVLLVTVTAFTAFAAATPKIDGMQGSLALGYSTSSDTVDLGDVYPNDELLVYIDLLDTMFTWTEGYAPDPGKPTKLTSKQIRDGKLTVRSNNTKVLEDVSISQRDGRIEIEFLTEHISTKEIDFDFTVTISTNNRRQSDYGMTFVGTFSNEVIEVDKDHDSVDISDGVVIEALESVSKLELDTGNGVTVVTRLSKNDKVYAVSSRTPDSSDDSMMRDIPAITDVINLKTSGLRTNSTSVKLGSEYVGYVVYNSDLEYLGKARDTLPLATKYYLVSDKHDQLVPLTEEPDIAVQEPDPADPEDNEPVDTDNPNTGGDDYSENANYNPNTGR